MVRPAVKKILRKIVSDIKNAMFFEGIFVEDEEFPRIRYKPKWYGYYLKAGMSRCRKDDFFKKIYGHRFELSDVTARFLFSYEEQRPIQLSEYNPLLTIYPAGIYMKIRQAEYFHREINNSDATRLMDKLHQWAKDHSEFYLGDKLGYLIASEAKISIFKNSPAIYYRETY